LLCLDSLSKRCVYRADYRKHRSSFAVPLLLSCLLLRERVYRVVVQKRPWYIRPPRDRYIATDLNATI
jgi:hypothetical protein